MALYSVVAPKAEKNKEMSNHSINLLKVRVWYDIWHYNKLNIGRQQNPYQMAWIGLDCRSDRTLDQIELDLYFLFWCRRIVLRKAVFNNDTDGSE